MKRFALLASIALMPIAACSSNPPPPTPIAAPTPPPLASADAAFVTGAAQSGVDEVQFGQLAATKAGTPAVRRFASNMVDAHTKLNQQLMQIVQNKGVTPPPTTLDPQHQTDLDALTKLRGRAFDRMYLNGQVVDHQTTLALFQQEAQQGTDPDLKAFAASGVPVIQQHLAMARRLGGRS